MDEIRNYYVIGDLHSAALVSKQGSIDWLCWPHFDSPSLFAKLLDQKAGCFNVDSPNCSITSEYVQNTAIVEFTFTSKNSQFILRDFMVPSPRKKSDSHFLIRKFIGQKGLSSVKLVFNPKPDYATKNPKLNFDTKNLNLKIKAKEDLLLLYPPKDAMVEETKDGFEISFCLAEDEVKSVTLEYISSGSKPTFSGKDAENRTVNFWRRWVKKGRYFEFCKDALIRSAITLKLMQFYPTGAIIAAPTTSLPEELGGERNWDYRFVWIRDATFTIYALYVLGYKKEAERFFEFIQKISEKCVDGKFELSLMYTIEGEPVPEEQILSHLSGYKNSKPVRVGNGAKNQFQLDAYGSLIDAYYFMTKRKITIHDLHKDIVLKLAKKIGENWRRPDSGIWEIRSGEQHFAYSKVMAWVGINRTLRLSRKLSLEPQRIEELKDLGSQIKDWIWKNCFDPVNQTFRQYPGTTSQDATNLLFVLLQFLDKHDPLTKKIIRQTCQELSFKEIFVYRYFTNDGLKGEEGAFLLCSFWLISAWAILEDVEEALRLFEKIEKYFEKSWLLSEEVDPETLEYLGNFPQAFSHIGFIMSAYYINKYSQRLNKNPKKSKIKS